MGKQTKKLDLQLAAEDTPPAMTVNTDPEKKPKKLDLVPVEEPKKKEDTEKSPVSEDGTKLPTSGESQQPSQQPTEPSENRTKLSPQEESEFQKWRLKLPQNLQVDTEDYDLRGAFKAGLEPDEEGHLPSRDPQTGLILKSSKHPTFAKTIEGENQAGFEIYQKDGRVYSRPKEANLWEALGKEIGTVSPIGRTFYDAGRRIISGFTDDAPKVVSTLKLKNAPRDFYDAFSFRKQPVTADIKELAPYVKEYQRWKIDNEDKLWDGFLFKTPKFEENQMVDQFFNEKYPDKINSIKALFNQKLIDNRLKSESDIQKQSKEASEKMAGSVQDYRDIKDLGGLASYIGTMGGQAAYQIPLSVLTRGASSLLQESATVYDQQLDNLARAKGITRDEVIKQKLDDPAAGQAYAVLAASLDAVSAFNILKAFRSSGGNLVKQWAKGAVPEAVTEPVQGVLERTGAKTGSETDVPALDTPLLINEAAGGLIGGSVTILGTKKPETVIEEQRAKVTDLASAEKAAETIEQKLNETVIEKAVEKQQQSTGVSQPKLDLEPVQETGEQTQPETGADSDVTESRRGEVDESTQQSVQKPITDEQATTDTGTGERISESPETQATNLETLRTEILNSPDDLKWDGNKVTILTDKGADMLRQYDKLRSEAKAGEQQTIEDDGTKRKTEEGQVLDTTAQQAETERTEQPASSIEELQQREKNAKNLGDEHMGSNYTEVSTEDDFMRQFSEMYYKKPFHELSKVEKSYVEQVAKDEYKGEGYYNEDLDDYVGSYEDVLRTFWESKKPLTDEQGQATGNNAVSTITDEGTSGTTAKVTQDTAVSDQSASTETVTPPPSPPQETQPAATSEQPETGERETIVKLQEESTLNDTLKEGIEDFKDYDKKNQSRSRQRAQDYIKKVGEDQALVDATSFKIGRTQEEKIALLSELADQFSNKFKSAEKSGDQKAIDEYYGKFMQAMNSLSQAITDTAQALSYMNLVGKIFETKTGAVRFATNQINESREGALKNFQELKMTAQQIIAEFDKLSHEEFLQSKAVQDLIAKMRKESPRSNKSRQADKRLNDAANRLRDLWRDQKNVGIIFDPKSQAKKDVEITKALVDYIKALIQKLAIDANEAVQNVASQVIEGVKSFSQEIGLQINEADVNDLVQDQITKEIEQKYRGDVKQAVQDFVQKKTGLQELTDKIIQAEGLTPEQAKEFTERFNKSFQEYLAKEKQRIVKQATPKTKKPNAKRKEFYDKVVELSNSGAVTDQQLEDVMASVFGLPQMTPEIATKIESMVDDINNAPEGRFRNIAITKLTDYIATQQRFNVSDYILASFRAGIFSGIDTQALNLTGNFFNVLELGFMLSMVNPKAAARFIGSVRNPTSVARSAQEALQILKTGFDPRVAGDAQRRVLEQRPRSFLGLAKGLSGAKQLLDPTLEQQKKFVFRALSAGDILFSYGISDALQNELYARQAKKLGLKGKDAQNYINEQLGVTPEKIKSAIDQATQEANQGQIPNEPALISLRAKEIMEQQRDPNIVEKSREYAQEQILTNTPKGYIGILARGINNVIRQLPVLAGLMPVVNFAANAMQRAVQYVPPAAVARGVAHYTQRMFQGENLSTIIKEDIQRLKDGDIEQEMRLRRFATGVISLAVMAALLDEDDKGENLLSQLLGKPVKVHGGGPGDKLNRQKTYQKQETGYLPYSVQIGDTFIPYRNYPGLNVLMSTFGEYEDAKRYDKLDKKDALNRLTFALANSTAVIAEMGFLTSLNTSTQAFLEGNPKQWSSIVARPIGGLIVPKFQRNIINFFDNQVYSGTNVQEVIVRSIPVLNTYGSEPLVNALGEPVERNWWDRVELWNKDAYSKHRPIWELNTKNSYYIPVPSKASLEKTFDKQLSTKEYNQFFKLRGDEIVKEFDLNVGQLASASPEEYNRKMDLIAEISKYRALVAMGVMETDLMKEIRYMLDDVMATKRETDKLKKEIK